MTDKPSNSEEEYFARENAEKMRKLAAEAKHKLDHDEREKLKAAHWMRCPKCGLELKEIKYQGVAVDRCFSCNGTFVPAGELDKLAGHKGELMNDLLRLFEHKKTP